MTEEVGTTWRDPLSRRISVLISNFIDYVGREFIERVRARVFNSLSDEALQALIVSELHADGFTKAAAVCNGPLKWRSVIPAEIANFAYGPIHIDIGSEIPRTRQATLAKLGSFDVEIDPPSPDIAVDDLAKVLVRAYQLKDESHIYYTIGGKLKRTTATRRHWYNALRSTDIRGVYADALFYACRNSTIQTTTEPCAKIGGRRVTLPCDKDVLSHWKAVYTDSLVELMPVTFDTAPGAAGLAFARTLYSGDRDDVYDINGAPDPDHPYVQERLREWLLDHDHEYLPVFDVDGIGQVEEYVHYKCADEILAAADPAHPTVFREELGPKPGTCTLVRSRSGFVDRHGVQVSKEGLEKATVRVGRVLYADTHQAWRFELQKHLPGFPGYIYSRAADRLHLWKDPRHAKTVPKLALENLQSIAGPSKLLPWGVLEKPLVAHELNKGMTCIFMPHARRLKLLWDGVERQTTWLFFETDKAAYRAIFQAAEVTLTDEEASDLTSLYVDTGDALRPHKLIQDTNLVRDLVAAYLANTRTSHHRDTMLEHTEKYRKRLLDHQDFDYPFPQLTDKQWGDATPTNFNTLHAEFVRLFNEATGQYLVRHPTEERWACVPSREHAIVYVLRALKVPDLVANLIAERVPADFHIRDIAHPHSGTILVDDYDFQRLIRDALDVNTAAAEDVSTDMSEEKTEEAQSRWGAFRAGLAGVAAGVATGAGIAAAERLNNPVVDLVIGIEKAFFVPRFVRESRPNRLFAELVGPFACAAIGHGLRDHLPAAIADGLALAGKLGGAGVGHKLATRLINECGANMMRVADNARALSGDADAMRRVLNTTATEVNPVKKVAELDEQLDRAAQRLGVDPARLREELEPVYAR